TDANALTIGTVTDGPSAMTTSGITTSDGDVKLTAPAGRLTIGHAPGPVGGEDMSLGTGNLTLNVVGAVTQTANTVITAAGLQLLGSGTVTLKEGGNNVATPPATYTTTFPSTDANALTIGTVTDGPSAMTTSGITTSGGDVKLTVLAGGLRLGDAVGPLDSDKPALRTRILWLHRMAASTQTGNNAVTAAGFWRLSKSKVH